MAKTFTVNINRFDPYKAFRFLVYFGTSTAPDHVRNVSSLRRAARAGSEPSGRGAASTGSAPI